MSNRRTSHVIAGLGILFVSLSAACAAARADEVKPAGAGDSIQALLDRVKQMNDAEQQSWLAQLEQRSARAARLTLSPAEAAKHNAHTQSLLHQPMVTWQVLREVIADAEAREKMAANAEAAKNALQLAAAKPQAVKKTFAKPQPEETKPAKSQPVERVVAKPQVEPSKVARPDMNAAAVEKLPPGSVTVNVTELEAQIAACNLALRELESDLSEQDVAWSAAKLEPLLERLKTLVVRHDDLGLFRNIVPKDERSGVTGLESPKLAISQLSARVVEARNRASDPKSASDGVERQAELTRLNAISHRLGELGAK